MRVWFYNNGGSGLICLHSDNICISQFDNLQNSVLPYSCPQCLQYKTNTTPTSMAARTASTANIKPHPIYTHACHMTVT